ncbi:MAG: hypothetical protein HYV53_04445 [Parcubacteria group bacterium]|nr:hypothetical protein [Parcubacteria group bacterium]
MEITISSFLAKIILRFNPFKNTFLVMCRGYSDDCENLTELVWEDDKYLDFYSKEEYPEFQIWFIPERVFYLLGRRN